MYQVGKGSDSSWFPWRIVLSTWHGLVAWGKVDQRGIRQAGDYHIQNAGWHLRLTVAQNIRDGCPCLVQDLQNHTIHVDFGMTDTEASVVFVHPGPDPLNQSPYPHSCDPHKEQ